MNVPQRISDPYMYEDETSADGSRSSTISQRGSAGVSSERQGWAANGQLIEKLTMLNKRTVRGATWYRSGAQRSVSAVVDEIETREEWYEDGKRKVVQKSRGLELGEGTAWYDNGNMQWTVRTEADGVQVGGTWSREGVPLSEITIADGNVVSTHWYPSGNKKSHTVVNRATRKTVSKEEFADETPLPLVEATDTKVDAATGITWVFIPGGTFPLGCLANDQDCERDERKPPTATSVNGFWMSKSEVTVSQYKRCVKSGACSKKPELREEEEHCSWAAARGDFPVGCVTFAEARSFCRWARGRIPKPTEWEYAAKGGQARLYPWGDAKPDKTRANICGNDCSRDRLTEDLTAVGVHPAGVNRWGVQDLAGNVAEWADEMYADDGRYQIRGGSMLDRGSGLRNSDVESLPPSEWSASVGIRCVR